MERTLLRFLSTEIDSHQEYRKAERSHIRFIEKRTQIKSNHRDERNESYLSFQLIK
jgi:hypothetical protein